MPGECCGSQQVNNSFRHLWYGMDGRIDLFNLRDEIFGSGLVVSSEHGYDSRRAFQKVIWEYGADAPWCAPKFVPIEWARGSDSIVECAKYKGLSLILPNGGYFDFINEDDVDGTSRPPFLRISDPVISFLNQDGIIEFNDELIFRTSTPTERARFDASGYFVPGAANTYQLGTDALEWSAVYSRALYSDTGNDLLVSAAEQLKLSAGGSLRWVLETDGDWIPQTDAALDLGSLTSRVDNFYGRVFSSVAAASLVKVQSKYDDGIRLASDLAINFSSTTDATGAIDTKISRDAAGIIFIQDDMRLRHLEIDGTLNHDGTMAGFYGAGPVAVSTGWTTGTFTEDKTVPNSGTGTLSELYDIVSTLIETFKTGKWAIGV